MQLTKNDDLSQLNEDLRKSIKWNLLQQPEAINNKKINTCLLETTDAYTFFDNEINKPLF